MRRCIAFAVLIAASGCGPADRCRQNIRHVSLDDDTLRAGEERSYRELTEGLVGAHTTELTWRPQLDPEARYRFELDHSTTAHVDIRYQTEHAVQERWDAAFEEDEERCPVAADVIPLDVSVQTEDGALDEQFSWDWPVSGFDTRRRAYTSVALTEPSGSLRATPLGELEDEYHVLVSWDSETGAVTVGVHYDVIKRRSNGYSLTTYSLTSERSF